MAEEAACAAEVDCVERGRSGSHSPALFRAMAARGRAGLAVLSLVLAALVAARLANGCANPAELRGELAAASHVGGRQAAYRCAVDIECDAPRHHFDVLLLQAGG